jgi:hypothetical protein
MPKPPFHQTFPKLIDRLAIPAPVRIVKMIGTCTCFPHEGHVTVHAWGRAMVRLGLATSPGDAGNPHDFIPEGEGQGRKPFHDALLYVVPRIQDEMELRFVQTLVNQTEIPEAGRGAIEHAWRLQLETLGHIHDLDATDYPLYFGDVPKEASPEKKLSKAA